MVKVTSYHYSINRLKYSADTLFSQSTTCLICELAAIVSVLVRLIIDLLPNRMSAMLVTCASVTPVEEACAVGTRETHLIEQSVKHTMSFRYSQIRPRSCSLTGKRSNRQHDGLYAPSSIARWVSIRRVRTHMSKFRRKWDTLLVVSERHRGVRVTGGGMC